MLFLHMRSLQGSSFYRFFAGAEPPHSSIYTFFAYAELVF